MLIHVVCVVVLMATSACSVTGGVSPTEQDGADSGAATGSDGATSSGASTSSTSSTSSSSSASGDGRTTVTTAPADPTTATSQTSTTGVTTTASTATSTTSTTTTPMGILSSVNFEDGTVGTWALVDWNNAPLSASTETAPFGRSGKTLKINAGGGFTDGIFLVNTSLFPLDPSRFYVRFYIAIETALSQSHTTFAVVAGNATNSEVRMGGQFGYLVANLQSNDAQRRSGGNSGDPGQAPGVILTAGTWYCLEFYYDTPNQAMRTWLNDGEIVPLAISQPSDWTTTPSGAWMPTITQLKLGWQAYGGNPNIVHLDDVAVSETRIGC